MLIVLLLMLKASYNSLVYLLYIAINSNAILKQNEKKNFTFESELFEAANAGHNEAVQFIIKLGGDVDHSRQNSTYSR